VTESQRVAEGRWIPPLISFVKAKAQKIGGNFRLTLSPMSGTRRATHSWCGLLESQLRRGPKPNRKPRKT
jgi:hypothetical protein